jgi:serine/threonine protein kinase
MWALGVCIHVWLLGRLPFDGPSPYAIYTAIQHSRLSLPADPTVSPAARDLLTRLLDKNMETRLTANAMLEHPWVTRSGAEPLRICASPALHATAQDCNAAIQTPGTLRSAFAHLF